MKRQFLIFALFIFSCSFSNAQILMGLETEWTDDFRDWNIFTDDEEEEGELVMRWQQRMDWTVWDYRLGEETGSIKLKFKNDPSRWEVRGGGEIISIRMKWTNDIHEWTISDGSNKLTLKALYNNNLNDWRIDDKKSGVFEMYMEWQNDPRTWTIIDELDEEISFHFKMAIAFISIYHTIPKN